MAVVNLSNYNVVHQTDLIIITGSLSSHTGTIPEGVHSVLLTEPGSSTVYSDYVILTAGPTVWGTELITLTFGSEGSFGFDAIVAGLKYHGTTTIAETGGVQDLTGALGSNRSLTITLNTAADVPEPGSFVLLGTGLLAGLAYLRRR